MRRLRLAAIVAAVLVGGLAIGVTVALLRGPAALGTPRSGGSPASRGWAFDRPVPSRDALTTARGGRLTLGNLRGRVVVLAPTMTLCHEVCPLTTGALMVLKRTIARDGLASRVAFVEATVDPWRDTPARLRAFDRMTGARLLQLTATVAQMRRFWRFFGIGFRRVGLGPQPDIDWWTRRPERFDVEHSDGVFLIDARGRERRFYPGAADVDGHLEPALRRLLSSTGIGNLRHPTDAWTPAQLLAGIRRLLGPERRAAQRSQRADGRAPIVTATETHMPAG